MVRICLDAKVSSEVVTRKLIESVSKCNRLEFYRCKFRKVDVFTQSSLNEVKELILTRCSGSGDNIVSALNLESVESLTMHSMSQAFLGTVIKNCKNLREIELQACVLSIPIAEAIAENKGLRSLWMSDCRIASLHLHHFATLPRLRKLWLHLNGGREEFAHESIMRLLDSSSLRFLDLLGRVSDESCELLRSYNSNIELVF